MYVILNKTLELLPLYHSNQQRFLDLKFKYRKEQDDMKYKIVRMINIELEQFNKHNQSFKGQIITDSRGKVPMRSQKVFIFPI